MVVPALGEGLLGRRRWRGTGGRRFGRQVGKEPQLLGVEAFGARTVQPPQQLIQPRLHLLQLVVAAAQQLEHLLEHALEDDGIVRQVGDRAGRSGREGRGGAHTLVDARPPPRVHGRLRKRCGVRAEKL